MLTETQANTSRIPIRSPPMLVPIISEGLKLVKRDVVEIGKMMLEARGQMTHAEFLKWSKKHFNLKRTQTLDYLAIGKSATTSGTAGPIDSVRSHNRTRRKKTTGSNNNKSHNGHANGNASNNGRAHTSTASTSTSHQEHQIGIDLIEAGFRTLAKTMHPDKGGSQTAMAALNKVRAKLKKLWC